MAALKRKKGGAGVADVTTKKPKTLKVSKRELKKVKETVSTLRLEEVRVPSQIAAVKRKSDETGDSATTAKKPKTSNVPTIPKRGLKKVKKLDTTSRQEEEGEGEGEGRGGELASQVVSKNGARLSSKEKAVKEKRQPVPQPLPKTTVAQKIVDEEVSESDDWSSDGDDGEEGSDNHNGVAPIENNSGDGMYTIIVATNHSLIILIYK